MTHTPHISPAQVKHIANLAQIPISENETKTLSDAFEETLKIIENLKTVDVTAVEITNQVTNLENVLRDDKIEPERMFSQDQSLQNASQKYQGYFVVPRLIDTESQS